MKDEVATLILGPLAWTVLAVEDMRRRWRFVDGASGVECRSIACWASYIWKFMMRNHL